MGFAIAAEAARRGAEVTLVAGPTTIEPPPVREVVRVRSAAEMHEAVHGARRRMPTSSSWRRRSPTTRRTAPAPAEDREEPADRSTLVLMRTPDILAELGPARVAAGQRPAAGRLRRRNRATSVARGREKRARKHVDLIVANDVSRADAGFDVDTNAVTIIGADGAEDAAAADQDARRRARSSIASEAAARQAVSNVRVEQSRGARAVR